MTRASDTAKLLGAGATILDGTTISTADNTSQLTLTSTDADAGRGAMLDLVRNSASPADNDLCGTIRGLAKNDAGEDIVLAEIIFRNEDVTDGTEDGQIIINCERNGAAAGVMKMSASETIMNYDQVDLDFRVASDNNANALLVDAGTDDIFFGCNSLPSSGTGGAAFELSQSSARSILQLGNTGTSNLRVTNFYNGNGNIGNISLSGSATSFNTSSDYRLKENVVTDWDATTRLKQLKPSRFNFIADADTTVDGFLAHEVSSVVPEAISGTKDEVDADGNPVHQSIDQSKLVPLLVKTIQELEARITALES